MKARIDYFCKPASKNAPYELENISIVVELPFAPSVGTMLKVTEHADYVAVADVHLDLSPDGEGLVIGLEEPDDLTHAPTWKEMKAAGWSRS